MITAARKHSVGERYVAHAFRNANGKYSGEVIRTHDQETIALEEFNRIESALYWARDYIAAITRREDTRVAEARERRLQDGLAAWDAEREARELKPLDAEVNGQLAYAART